jgi:hypothetical protein
MAPTKKKRQTKHRGNAAGQVEARGRTGRKPTATERGGKPDARQDARARRLARLDQPPTWRSAVNRAFIATGLFLVLLLFLFRHQQFGPKLGIAAFMLLIYVPLGYYTDLFVYRRRQARKLREQAAKKAAPGE